MFLTILFKFPFIESYKFLKITSGSEFLYIQPLNTNSSPPTPLTPIFTPSSFYNHPLIPSNILNMFLYPAMPTKTYSN